MSISNSQSNSHKMSSQVEHVGDYIIKEKIGQGSFATVYKAQHKYTNQIVAVKSVKRSKLTKKLLENLESEISILTAIRHDHIVGLIECQKTESNIYLVMEFCSLGDLSHYIKDIRTNKSLKGPAGGLPERVVRHFLKQLANALEFLRSQNLVHRDIKPQNLLLVQPPDSTVDSLPILKVADFGFARFLPGANLADTLCGSPLYMGPEILSYKKYDAKADLWSVGAVLFEMVTGKPPFRAQNHIELLKKIQENNDHIIFPTEGDIGHDIKDLIRKLLKKNPVERLSFEEFFHHPAVLYNVTIRKSSSSSSSKTSLLSSRASSLPKVYEPPPFSPRNHNEETKRRWSFNKDNTTITTAATTISTPLTISNNSKSKRKEKEEQSMLQDYVVLDRRIIETNQFADELDASPRNTPSSAVNIPTSPSSTPPFVRERKTSSASSSAGSALAKALNKASVRLFGPSVIPSPPKDAMDYLQVVKPHGYMIPTTTHNRTLKHIERLSCMAHAVSLYGDQKYEVYLNQQQQNREQGDEACLLYIKSLALLELGLNVAQQYWQNYLTEEDKQQAALLNHFVQYMRDRFNHCLKKAETIQDRSMEHASVEKLLYDRALEMSRAAAVHELVGENISECEHDYQTAMWMLEAILQVRPSEEMTIEEDDRRIINTCNTIIDSIRHRKTVLRKKMESAERI